jgi:hypothetical protein
LLKNPASLSDKKVAELYSLIEIYPKIGEGYRLKELFREFWEFDKPDKTERFLSD